MNARSRYAARCVAEGSNALVTRYMALFPAAGTLRRSICDTEKHWQCREVMHNTPRILRVASLNPGPCFHAKLRSALQEPFWDFM